MNFAAYALPQAPEGLIPDGCAPVNQFRWIFNHYFDAGLPILPQHHYYSEFGKAYAFQEVPLLWGTSRLQTFASAVRNRQAARAGAAT